MAKAKQALATAISALYFDDNSDYSSALWEIVKLLGGQEAVDLLESDAHGAYEKYSETPAKPNKKVIPIISIK